MTLSASNELGGRPDARRDPRPVPRRALMALPLLAALPVLLFAMAVFAYLSHAQQRALESEILQVARYSNQAGDVLLEARLSTLRALGSLAVDGNVSDFARQARLLLMTRPDWRSITLRDPEGELLAAESRPGESPPPADVELAKEGTGVTSAWVVRDTDGLPMLLARLTVSRPGQETYVISARLDLEAFSQALVGLADPQWTLALLDSRHVIAGRSRDAARFVGNPATPSLQAEIDASDERFFYALNQEGERVYTAFSTSTRTGWTAAIGAPAVLVEAPLRQARLAWIGGGLGAFSLAAILAWLLAHTLLRRQAAERKAWQLESEREAEARLTDIAGHFPGVMYRRVLRPDGTVSFPYVSPGAAELLGATPEELARPRPLKELANDLVAAGDHPKLIDALTRSAAELTPYSAELRVRRSDGGTAWIRSTASARRAPDGSVIWDGVMTDITSLKMSEDALKARTDALRATTRVNATIASELDRDTLVQAVLDAGRVMIGAAFGSFFYNVQEGSGEALMLYKLSGARYEDFAHFPMPRSTGVFGPTMRGEGIIRMEDVTADPRYGQMEPFNGMPKGHLPVRSYLAAPVISRTGEVLGLLLFGHPEPGIFDETAEEIVSGLAAQAAVALENARLFKAAEDEIARRRSVEDQQKMLLAELNHRVKNTLAVVLAIAQQTAKTCRTLPEFGEVFRGRITALATAHTLLTAGSWRSTTLAKLVETALEPHAEPGSERVRVAGPEVIVPPKQALALSLVLHELATNASKYGALSTGEGELNIEWGGGKAGELCFRWHERVPGPIAVPEREGFGSRLITMNVNRELGGKVSRDYTHEGLRAEICLPWNPETGELVSLSGDHDSGAAPDHVQAPYASRAGA